MDVISKEEKYIPHDAIYSMICSENVSIESIAKGAGVEYEILLKIHDTKMLGSLSVDNYLKLADYAEIYFKYGRQFVSPVSLTDNEMIGDMDIYLLCEYLEGFVVRFDLGKGISVSKFIDRNIFNERILDPLNLYFECCDEAEVQMECIAQIKRYIFN
ncbi:hypothetical protein CIRMBP1230_01066 [Enterococcus cecorum]|uniref:hypothetical protein n=1 Tax=Enterococcus cecorum TaxID=44008 RepID=UPI0022DC0DB5|nr:hypothetical protein [Enterococcus cecorum]CAI3297700.1 hypothetical protein CIRMBP1281_00645 [Enterococcus cecorum]CAI3299435.1 hypothetical protein CIRMBP1228_00638 [Enterococcus cecorum]CAI3311109.1 hypothetical protein CIRMBP1252_00796 [Enterococcus cecorum]CAI3321644.1 hypothetical protein CIRMBP1224_00877 [Enterococcus cecorum]CAI3329813.1 hypothetical protein CIRMBP1208_00775 [Enterococcus cecorum]